MRIYISWNLGSGWANRSGFSLCYLACAWNCRVKAHTSPGRWALKASWKSKQMFVLKTAYKPSDAGKYVLVAINTYLMLIGNWFRFLNANKTPNWKLRRLNQYIIYVNKTRYTYDIYTLPTQKLWHFHKNIRLCVENECCCPRTVNIMNVGFT